MTERQNGRSNAAWQAARQWQERARHTRPSSPMSGPKLLLTWLMFGVMMIIGTLFGLFFLLVGWLMLPFLRHRMKKRAEAFRAQQAHDVGGDVNRQAQGRTHANDAARRHNVLEGEYEIRKGEKR